MVFQLFLTKLLHRWCGRFLTKIIFTTGPSVRAREMSAIFVGQNFCFVGSLEETEFIFVLLLTLTLPIFGLLVGSFRAKAATQAMAGDRDVRVGL